MNSNRQFKILNHSFPIFGLFLILVISFLFYGCITLILNYENKVTDLEIQSRLDSYEQLLILVVQEQTERVNEYPSVELHDSSNDETNNPSEPYDIVDTKSLDE